MEMGTRVLKREVMMITILELAQHRGLKENESGGFGGQAFYDVGLDIMGGCAVCGASLAAYNACPSKHGVWMCEDICIADDGWTNVKDANREIFGE